MKTLLRTFLSTLLTAVAIIAGLSLQSCGEGGGADDGTTVVQFWHFWSEPAQKEALRKRIAAFEEVHPDIRVEMSELSWNDGKSKLLAAFNSGTAPDVLELGSDWVAQFSSAGVLANQKESAGTNRFVSTVLEPGTWESGLYAIPWVIDTRVLYINTELLARAGVDTTAVDTLWSDVLQKAEKVRALGGDVYGFGANGPDRHRLYKKIIPFFWSNGGQVLDAQGMPAINSAENVEALRTYLELARTGLYETQKGLDQLFLQGKLAYWISGAWLADRIGKDNPSLRYDMSPLPTFPGGASVSFAGGEYLAINEDSDRKEAAAALVSFLTSPEQALQFCKDLGGYAPADRSVSSDPFLQSAARRPYTVQLATSRMTPVHPKWLDLEAIIEEEVSEALLGNKTEQQALDDAQKRMEQLLAGSSAMAGDTTESQ